MAYGDSYSAVQSADLAEEQARRQAYQHSLANASRGFADMRQANIDQLAVQRMADEDLKWKLNMNRLEKNDAALQEDRNRRLEMDRDYLGIQKQQIAKGDAVERRNAMARAYESADRGLIDTPEQAVELFGLDAPFAHDVFNRSQQARSLKEADYEDAQHAAATLNLHRKTQTEIASLKKQAEAAKPGWFTKGDPGYLDYMDKLAKETATLERLTPLVEFAKKSSAAQFLIPNEDGTYGVSKSVVPTWIKSSNAPEGEAPMQGGLPTRGRSRTAPAAAAPTAAAPPPAGGNRTTPVPPGFPPDYFEQVRALVNTGIPAQQAIANLKLKYGLQ